MHPQPSTYDVANTLPVIIVIACTAIVAIAISAWLIRDVAHRAIERSSPDKVPAVLVALGSLLYPLRLFLPWSGHRAGASPPAYGEVRHDETLHNESSPTLQKGTGDEA